VHVLALILARSVAARAPSEDHSGKMNPDWSGCPVFPPLGFFLGLETSVDMHEAHHNWGRCSYGLLGVADRVFGTARYATDPARNRDQTPAQRKRRLRRALLAACASLAAFVVMMACGGAFQVFGVSKPAFPSIWSLLFSGSGAPLEGQNLPHDQAGAHAQFNFKAKFVDFRLSGFDVGEV
jgi:hypothetical protein